MSRHLVVGNSGSPPGELSDSGPQLPPYGHASRGQAINSYFPSPSKGFFMLTRFKSYSGGSHVGAQGTGFEVFGKQLKFN